MLNRAWVMTLVALFAAGCATPADAPHAASPRESERAVTRLILVERPTGAAAVLDVAGQAETGLGEFGRVDAVSGDGRYAYLHGDAGTTVLDGGAWTFDHGDHSHFYDGRPTVVGQIEGRIAAVRASGALAVARRVDGSVATLDRDAFARGAVMPPSGVGDHEKTTAAFALGDDVLTVTERGQVTRKAETTAVLGDCPAVTDAAVLRRAVVLGCRDGALKVSRRSGAPVVESIPFATRPLEALGPFGFRRQGNSLAAVAGDEVWLLNGRRWASMRLPGVVAVNTADASTVLALTRDGVLHALDVAAGADISRIDLLAAPVGAPVIEVGAGRAYVNDASARAVHEIDYADGLRMVRTYRTDVTPDFLAAAGW